VQKEGFSRICLSAIRKLDERPSIFIKDGPIFSSERVLHKHYDRKDSVTKKTLVVSLEVLFDFDNVQKHNNCTTDICYRDEILFDVRVLLYWPI
jgi:hypothetical protein